MNTEKYIEKIMEGTGLSKSDIERLIFEKNQLKGLISEEGALFIISRELSVGLEPSTKNDLTFIDSEPTLFLSGQRMSFKDDYEVKLEYSCDYDIYNWNNLKKYQKKRELALEPYLRTIRPDSNYVRIVCTFEDYIPLAKKIESTLEDDSAFEQKIHQSSKIHRARTWVSESWMLKDEIDPDRFSEWETDDTKDEISILKGFTTWLIFPEETLLEEIQERVKNWVKDLVVFFVIPQVEIKQSFAHGYIIKTTRPENYIDLERTLLSIRFHYMDLNFRKKL